MTTLTKPVRRVAEGLRLPHGFRDRLILTLRPGAIVEIREPRRKEAVVLDLGALYAKAIMRQALEKARTARRRAPR